jgi:hypothetical protein
VSSSALIRPLIYPVTYAWGHMWPLSWFFQGARLGKRVIGYRIVGYLFRVQRETLKPPRQSSSNTLKDFLYAKHDRYNHPGGGTNCINSANLSRKPTLSTFLCSSVCTLWLRWRLILTTNISTPNKSVVHG